MDEALPTAVRRLFPHVDPAAVLAPEHRDFLIERLLEEGDGEDLRWLFSHLGEDAVRRWLVARSAGRLSRRSRAFWGIVFQLDPPPAPAEHDALWPL